MADQTPYPLLAAQPRWENIRRDVPPPTPPRLVTVEEAGFTSAEEHLCSADGCEEPAAFVEFHHAHKLKYVVPPEGGVGSFQEDGACWFAMCYCAGHKPSEGTWHDRPSLL